MVACGVTTMRALRAIDPRSRLGLLYWALVVLRCISALFGYAYIHPDEWMQSGEAYFGAASLPWEWQPRHALRSPAALRAQNAAVPILSLLTSDGGWGRFVAQRAAMVVWTLVVDAAVVATLEPGLARRLLCLYGVSSAATTFMVRPFSNSTEAALLALSLVFVLAFVRDDSWYRGGAWKWTVPVLPVMTAVGVFIRFTYVAFAAPVLALYLVQLVGLARKGYAGKVAGWLAVAAGSGVATTAAYLGIDTQFYTRAGAAEVASVRWRGMEAVVAPLNALAYNAQTDNVAQHGLHPRWLHLCVNLPIMVGVANVAVLLIHATNTFRGWLARQGCNAPNSTRDGEATGVSLCIVVVALCVLSVSPHQEPRFLLALAFPSAMVMAHALGSRFFRTRPRLVRWLVTLHVAQHLLQMVLFSFLHQAALLPTLFAIEKETSLKTHLVYRTFPVPTHLTPHKDVRGFDSSTSPQHLLQIAKQACGQTAIYTPSWFVAPLQHLARDQGVSLTSQRHFTGHVDLDHLDSALALLRTSPVTEVFAIHQLLVTCPP